MSEEYRAKLRSISFGAPRKPRSAVIEDRKRVEVIRDADGTCGGWHDHHGSGRVDATVTPAHVSAHSQLEE